MSIAASAGPWITIAGALISPRRSWMSSRPTSALNAGRSSERGHCRHFAIQVSRPGHSLPRTMAAIVSASWSFKPSASQTSSITLYVATFSGSSIPAWVPSRISAATRSGCLSAKRRATMPPWLIPPITARSIPRWSSSPLRSSARSQYVNGSSVVSVSPWQRASQVMNRRPVARSLICGANMSQSMRSPCARTMGGPLFPPVSS